MRILTINYTMVFTVFSLLFIGMNTVAVAKSVKVDICHHQGNGNFHTININENAIPAHVAHGDHFPETFFADVDADNYGDPINSTEACEQPSGFVIDNSDCDDTDAEINLEAKEIPGNDIDEDCNPATLAKAAFVTSATYDGNLGGLAGADAKCQQLANVAGLSGVYLAWLSDHTGSPATQFTQVSVDYALVDGQVIANGFNDLTDAIINVPISLDENANDVNAGGEAEIVWSNTRPDGTFNVPNHCANWMSNSATMNNPTPTGDTTVRHQGWTNGGGRTLCDSFLRLYCFEQ